jgi:DNA modification methylase
MITQFTSGHHACFLVTGDSRQVLNEFRGRVNLIVTSPPYADARKKHYDSIAPRHYPEWFLTFHEAFWEALAPDGSFVLNIKDKVEHGVRSHFVWKTIERMVDKGWHCIDDYIWHKPNPMPGYWPTRLRDGWEYCFHLAKTVTPFINHDAVRVPIGDWAKSRLRKLGNGDLQRHNSVNESGFGRDISKWVDREHVLPSNVLSIPLVGKNKGHPAVFPIELPSFFIKLLCPPRGLVADPFAGSGTTGIAALRLHRNVLLIDNNSDYTRIAQERLVKEARATRAIQLDEYVRSYENQPSQDQFWQPLIQFAEKQSAYCASK